MTPQPVSKRGEYCPSCDRFIGPADICPYCSEGSAKSPFIRRLRYGAILLAVFGLAALYLMVTHRELPVVKVETISPMMNFAYVRIVGTVRFKPSVREQYNKVDYLSFVVDDGTGDLRVRAYRKTARRLIAANGLPQKGDTVDVAGSLNVAAEGEPKLTLQSTLQLTILPRASDSEVPGGSEP